MTKIIITLLIAWSCLFAVSCGNSASQVPHHVFLLQLVHTAQIVKTPDLKQYRSIPRLRKIIDNRSIDGGLPVSPLIKKLKILDDTRNCLFAPADSIYDFPLTAAKHARLRFGFAMTDEYLKHRRVPTAFKIWIKERGEQSFPVPRWEMIDLPEISKENLEKLKELGYINN